MNQTNANPNPAQAHLSQNEVMRRLIAIWQEVLGFTAIEADDDFFELGGNSLSETQVVARINATFNLALSVLTLYESPTLHLLAQVVVEAIHGRSRSVQVAIEPAPRNGKVPLSYAQQQMWFLDQLAPHNPFYNLPQTARLIGALNRSALLSSLNRIVGRHKALRTTFRAHDGQPFQSIRSARSVALPTIDLQNLVPDRRNTEAQRLVINDVRRVFDLAKAPPLRTTLLHIDEAEHVLIVTMHHIISDLAEHIEAIQAINQTSQTSGKGRVRGEI